MASIFTPLIGNVTTTTQAATLLLPANADRKGLFLNATANIMIGNASVTNTSNGFRVLANSNFNLTDVSAFGPGSVFTGDLYFIATATCTCYAMSLQ
jgi:hypothetical protein